MTSPACLLLLLVFAYCAVASSEPEHVDVLIVGAGSAGMSAAATLFRHAKGLSVRVLEGRNYTGGRVHSRRFGAKNAEVIIEEGANWLHGQPPPGGRGRLLNPAWQLAQQAGIAMRRIPGSCANTSGYSVYNSNGTLFSPLGGAPQHHADTAFECANRTGRHLHTHEDMSFADALKLCEFSAPTVGTTRDTLYWEISQANLPLAINTLSLRWALPDPTYMYFGPDDHFVHEQRPRGYAAALDAMFHDKELQRRWDESIELNAIVKQISASPLPSSERVSAGRALVRVEDGREFHARHVISTLPLGVMQYDHASIFTSPPLSPSKVRGLNAYDMGNFTKIFIQFERNFWSERGLQWLVAEKGNSLLGAQRDPMEFHDIDALIPGSKTLFTYVAGPDCEMWSKMTNYEASAALVAILGRHFPSIDHVPNVTSFFMTRHFADKFMRGAYSVSKVGFSMDEFNAIVEPHGSLGNVLFAGEHTCAAFQGYVHGGILSGKRAAAEVMLASGMGNEAGKAYDWSCETLRANHTWT